MTPPVEHSVELPARHPPSPTAGEVELRRERSKAKLRQCLGASVTNARRSEVLEPDGTYVIEEVALRPPLSLRPGAGGTDIPAHSRVEPTFVMAPRPWWESSTCCAFFCAFALGCFVGGGFATLMLLSMRQH